MSQPLASAPVTILDVYTKQVELGAQLAVIHEQLKAIPDHEARIRALERWRYSTPVAMIAGLGSAAVAAWSLLHQ